MLLVFLKPKKIILWSGNALVLNQPEWPYLRQWWKKGGGKELKVPLASQAIAILK